jgi:hypothetical protein
MILRRDAMPGSFMPVRFYAKKRQRLIPQ